MLNVKRGCKDYIKFADLHHLPEIPESQEEVPMYGTYSLHERLPTFDSSTLTSYVGNVNTFINGLRSGGSRSSTRSAGCTSGGS